MKRPSPLALLLPCCFLILSLHVFAQDFAHLKGKWVCQTDYGPVELEFVSESQLIFGGEPAPYQLIGRVIRVTDDYGQYDYPYQFQDTYLLVSFPEGYTLAFSKSPGSGQQPGPASPDQQANTPGPPGPPPASTPEGGEQHLLTGKLCHWSGSSSYSSSYSSSTWVWFDGRGNFSWGTESSFSSDAGMAYGQDPGQGNRGTYQVKGNQVFLTFSDGSRGVASVHFRQNNGQITELKYEGDLYAAGLCE